MNIQEYFTKKLNKTKIFNNNISFLNAYICCFSNYNFGYFRKLRGTDTAMICIHGGPGYPHDYLENLFDLDLTIPIVMYDQAGCGESASAFSQKCFDINYYPEEVEKIRSAYGIKKLIIYGHSWGSIIAYEYYRKYPNNVSSVIFSSPCLSIPRWLEDSQYYQQQLSNFSQEAIKKANTSYNYLDKNYLTAVAEYYRICVFKSTVKPDVLLRCDARSNPEIYAALWGINEFTIHGKLKNYNAERGLTDVTVPCLYVAGEFDECLANTIHHYRDLTPNAESAIIKNSRHFANIENFPDFKIVIENYIKKILN